MKQRSWAACIAEGLCFCGRTFPSRSAGCISCLQENTTCPRSAWVSRDKRVGGACSFNAHILFLVHGLTRASRCLGEPDGGPPGTKATSALKPETRRHPYFLSLSLPLSLCYHTHESALRRDLTPLVPCLSQQVPIRSVSGGTLAVILLSMLCEKKGGGETLWDQPDATPPMPTFHKACFTAHVKHILSSRSPVYFVCVDGCAS
ncbi:hypothetical protein LZ30DRAFT_472913 [Colletotrichum cereale]|nr:hypothetical protein LZ30DRAFT_472913 [Colletotrichum cereale]